MEWGDKKLKGGKRSLLASLTPSCFTTLGEQTRQERIAVTKQNKKKANIRIHSSGKYCPSSSLLLIGSVQSITSIIPTLFLSHKVSLYPQHNGHNQHTEPGCKEVYGGIFSKRS